MATTTFVDNTTLSDDAWFNDADSATYAHLTSPAGTNTITATGPKNLSLATGIFVRWIPAGTNTGATTLNITPSGGSALTAKNVFCNGVACIGGEIVSGLPAAAVYDGTQYQLISGARTRWTTPTFAAGDYTANGSMTWTVEAGDVTTFAYAIHDKMMTVIFTLTTTTVGGTLNTLLQVVIPASKTATKTVYTRLAYIDNVTRKVNGYASVAASGTVIRFEIGDGANWEASTNGTAIAGEITFEIN